MTTDEDLMAEMLDRATSPNKDELFVLSTQMFVMIVRSDPKLVLKAQEMIAAKLRSNNVEEATKAVEVLKECMIKCGTEFQDEIAKFRFLNYLIRIVSTKYDGNQTPLPIKQRIMECLLLWTTDYPEKNKIHEVYDMLSKENIGHVEMQRKSGATSTAGAIAKKECTLGIDEQVFAKLIHSNNPEDFKRANILIQHRVNQEARRTELYSQQRLELEEVNQTITVLKEMLDAYEADSSNAENGGDTLNLMRELYVACKKHKPIIKGLPSLLDQTDEKLTADVLETYDLLVAVMNRYKTLIIKHSPSTDPKPTTTMATNQATTSSNTTDLLAQLLGDVPPFTLPNTTIPLMQQPSTAATAFVGGSDKEPRSTLDELSVIFGDTSIANNENNNSFKTTSESTGTSTEFSWDLLKPVVVAESDVNATKECATEDDQAKKSGLRELREIDKISEELLKLNLSHIERVGKFKKEPERITLNDLVKDKTSEKSKGVLSNNFENGVKEMVPEEMSSSDPKQATVEVDASLKNKNDDDVMLETNAVNEVLETKNIVDVTQSTAPDVVTSVVVKSLAEIEIKLEEVIPTSEERVLLNDDDVKITLNFTKDRPSRNVSVIVISATNKNKEPLKDFIFEASVKKPSKVRLLTPTASSLPPYRPFPPPTPINQVMLLLNPTGKSADVTCIVGYRLGDDPDPIKESIVAKDIPYVD